MTRSYPMHRAERLPRSERGPAPRGQMFADCRVARTCRIEGARGDAVRRLGRHDQRVAAREVVVHDMLGPGRPVPVPHLVPTVRVRSPLRRRCLIHWRSSPLHHLTIDRTESAAPRSPHPVATPAALDRPPPRLTDVIDPRPGSTGAWASSADIDRNQEELANGSSPRASSPAGSAPAPPSAAGREAPAAAVPPELRPRVQASCRLPGALASAQVTACSDSSAALFVNERNIDRGATVGRRRPGLLEVSPFALMRRIGGHELSRPGLGVRRSGGLWVPAGRLAGDDQRERA